MVLLGTFRSGQEGRSFGCSHLFHDTGCAFCPDDSAVYPPTSWHVRRGVVHWIEMGVIRSSKIRVLLRRKAIRSPYYDCLVRPVISAQGIFDQRNAFKCGNAVLRKEREVSLRCPVRSVPRYSQRCGNGFQLPRPRFRSATIGFLRSQCEVGLSEYHSGTIAGQLNAQSRKIYVDGTDGWHGLRNLRYSRIVVGDDSDHAAQTCWTDIVCASSGHCKGGRPLRLLGSVAGA